MRMDLLHEKPFISALLPRLARDPCFLNGFGHDSSVIDLGFSDVALALKIDRAAKPMAALRGWADYSMWGRLAVTANCSDLLATGAVPRGFMLSVSVPGNWDSQAVEAIIFGAEEECRSRSVAYLGGDTKEASEAHVVGTALGTVEKKRIWGRSNARPGDMIVLAGELGGFTGAYLLADAQAGGEPISATALRCLTMPVARWDEAMFARQSLHVQSATDLSDGLFDGLQNLPVQGAGVEIDLHSLAYHPLAREAATKFSIPLLNLSFGVGDWGMLFALPPSDLEKISRGVAQGHQLSVIGRVITESGVHARQDLGRRFFVDGVVNQHFDSRMEDGLSFVEKLRKNITLRRGEA